MPRNLTAEEIAAFRERLCDAAERLFVERGIEAVTIRELAAAIGVSPMTPYRYFKDKDAILAAVRARAFDRHADALERAFAAAGPGPSERSAAIGEAYLDFALANPEAYRLMFDIAPRPGDLTYPELVRASERSRATMTAHLEDLAAAGVLPGDPDALGHLFWAALHGPIMLQLSGMLTPPHDARSLARGLMTALSQTLAARNR